MIYLKMLPRLMHSRGRLRHMYLPNVAECGTGALACGRLCALAIMALGLLSGLPAHADAAGPDEESVRRIVERAMAAVSLAEAEAARKVAEIQIRLAATQDSIYVLRQRIATVAAENDLLKYELSDKDDAIARLEMEKSSLQFSGAQYLDDLANLRTELSQNAQLLAAAQLQLSQTHEMRDELERREALRRDSAAAFAATIARMNDDNRALLGQVDALTRENTLAAGKAAGLEARLSEFGERLESERARLQSERDVLRARIADDRASRAEEVGKLKRMLADSVAILSDMVRRGAEERGALISANADLRAKALDSLEAKEAAPADSADALGLNRINASLRDLIAALEGGREVGATRDSSEPLSVSEVEATVRTLKSRITEVIAEYEQVSAALISSLEASQGEMNGAVRTLRSVESELKAAYAERDRVREALEKKSTAVDYDLKTASELELCRARILELEGRIEAVDAIVEVPVRDGDSEIPSKVPELDPPSAVYAPRSALLDALNRGGEAELAGLPGVGTAGARAILWYRESRGSFRVTEDLKFVPGFNDEKIEALNQHFRAKEETKNE